MTLIDCIAAIACGAGGRRSSAAITKPEKAKNTPAFSPQPSAVTSVSATRASLIAVDAAALGTRSRRPSRRRRRAKSAKSRGARPSARRTPSVVSALRPSTTSANR